MPGKYTMAPRPKKKPAPKKKKDGKTVVAMAPRPRKRPATKTRKATPKIRKA